MSNSQFGGLRAENSFEFSFFLNLFKRTIDVQEVSKMAKILGQMSDWDLLSELRGYNNATAAAPANYNLTASDATALGNDLNGFEAALKAWDKIQDDYDAALQAKNAGRRAAYERGTSQRRLTRDKAGIADATLASAGLEPYDTTKTDSPSPSSAPFALIDFGKLRHAVNFRDAATPDTDKKPDGMLGAEVWIKTGGDAPVDNKECEYLATDTATPYTATFTGADAGKTVWYLLRWVSKNGDKGDWSEAVAATVNG